MRSCDGWSRRDLVKTISAGMLGAAALPATGLGAFAKVIEPPRFRSRGGLALFHSPEESSNVALIKGNDRSENIYKALKLIETEPIMLGTKAR